jgi:hypothetical protein
VKPVNPEASLKSSPHLEGKTHTGSGTETLDLSDITIAQITIEAPAFSTSILI